MRESFTYSALFVACCCLLSCSLASKTNAPKAQPLATPLAPAGWATRLTVQLNADSKACAQSARYDGAVEECKATSVGNGKGVFISVVSECGGDSCSVESWLLRPDGGKALPLRDFEGGGFAFDATLSFYVMDQRRFHGEEDQAQNFYTRAPSLVRVELANGAPQPFADCFSPVLSPGGQWFVCRNPNGDLLRVPSAGGNLELVATNQFEGELAFSPYAFIYPEAAHFNSPEQVSFQSGGEADHEITVPWSEGALPGPAPKAKAAE